MILHINDLDTALGILNRVLPPIKYSINRDKNAISLTTELYKARKTRGSKSRRALAFYHFLFNRGDLILYIHNVFRYNTERLLFIGAPFKQSAEDFIDQAFIWGNTEEDEVYWMECHEEWLEYDRENNLK